jgi:hypothetical protein
LLGIMVEKYPEPQKAQRTQSSEVSATFAFRSGKAPKPQLRTRMTRIRQIFTDTINPCASVSSVKSVFHHSFSGMKLTCTKVSAFICVHLRFLKNVIFQTGLTGLTGYVFNPVYPVILSNLKCQTPASEQIRSCWMW